MAEKLVCPATGEACPLDENLYLIRDKFLLGKPDRLLFASVAEGILRRRARADCPDGPQESGVEVHCASIDSPQLQLLYERFTEDHPGTPYPKQITTINRSK